MKTNNTVLLLINNTIIKQIIFWPLWWYSFGFLIVLKNTGIKIVRSWKGLALDIWLKNIFRPMYGQYDATSRIISFLMRLVQVFFRFIIMVVMTVLILLIPVFYLGLPILAVWQLFVIK